MRVNIVTLCYSVQLECFRTRSRVASAWGSGRMAIAAWANSTYSCHDWKGISLSLFSRLPSELCRGVLSIHFCSSGQHCSLSLGSCGTVSLYRLCITCTLYLYFLPFILYLYPLPFTSYAGYADLYPLPFILYLLPLPLTFTHYPLLVQWNTYLLQPFLLVLQFIHAHWLSGCTLDCLFIIIMGLLQCIY